MTKLILKRVLPEEWEKYRDFKIRSVADAPQAFGDTLEVTKARPEAVWRQWAECSHTYVAEDNDEYVSMVTLRKDETDTWIVNGVWTDPRYRRQGLNRELFHKVFQVATSLDVKSIQLVVNQEQDAAASLYSSLGFKKTGMRHQVLTGDGTPCDQDVMVKEMSSD